MGFSTEGVEFCVTVFHCPHTTALSKAFPSYVIALYQVLSFVLLRHHQLGDDYWAAISYRLGFIARSKFGGVYIVGTHDPFGLRTGNQFLLVMDEVTILSIYVRSFVPFFG